MKKIIPILFLYLSIQTTQAMIIDNIVVSPLNSQDINIHLKVTEGAEFYFQNSSYNITKNSITLTVCYILSEPQLLILTTRENDIVISTVNNEVTNYNFTVIVNYIDEQGNCVTGPFSDSESMTFYTPLTNTISLSNNSFDNLNRNLIIIPNPTNGLLEFENDDKRINQVNVYDNLGRLVKKFDSIYNKKLDLIDTIYSACIVCWQIIYCRMPIRKVDSDLLKSELQARPFNLWLSHNKLKNALIKF